MAKTDDGEFELVLGNRQLLFVFFIVVVLLGVFFTMGWIVGKNSMPLSTAETPATKPAEPPAKAPEVKAPPEVTKDASKQQFPDTPKEAPPKEAAPKEVAKAPEPPPKKEEAAKKAPSKGAPGEPKPGTYLQLAATGQREAELMVEVLRKKGFPGSVAAVPKVSGTFRVLVGPIIDGQMNRMKTELQNSGFPGNIAIRRVYP